MSTLNSGKYSIISKDNRRMPHSETCVLKAGLVLSSRYTIIRILGQDSTGWMAEARDVELGNETIALKILLPQLLSDQASAVRLNNEVLIARQLTHPNIIRTHDIDQDPKFGHFISMEFIDGWSLRKVLTKAYKELKLDYKVKILYDIASALAAAHRRSVVHRDLRPENIMLSKQGDVKLGNFSISRCLETEVGITRTGVMLGTPQYMAPEQFFGDEIDCQTDIYAFGILAVELFCGATPWGNLDYLSLGKMRQAGELPELDTAKSDLPQWLPELIERCCSKEKSQRFSSGTALVEFLTSVEGSTLTKGFGIVLPSLQRQGQRNRRLSYLHIIASLIVAPIGLYTLLIQPDFRLAAGTQVLKFEQSLDTEFKLLKRMLNINGDWKTPNKLHELIKSQDVVSAAAMIAAGYDLNAMDLDGNSAINLGFVLSSNFVKKKIIESKPTLEFRDRTGMTPLERVINAGDIDTVELLLSAGANPNAVDKDGKSTIHSATILGNLEIVKLLAKRVNIDSLDSLGNSSLHIAIHLRRNDLVQALLSEGANVDVRDASGRTPLMLVLKQFRDFDQSSVLLQTLLTASASLTARDDAGETALFYATRFADSQAVETLIAANADVNLRNAKGQTVEEVARSLGFEDKSALLLQARGKSAAGAEFS